MTDVSDGSTPLDERSTQEPDASPAPPERIGPYRVLHRIGEGGMGTVYLAEQVRPIRRRVALKLIRWGMDTEAVIARFEAERQALALMNHPNVAKVLDAGATAEGRPYFVMEHVEGVPITEYCDRHRLATAERLRLFVRVCDAIQHAHHKGIIHRDIKPSNILVGTVDGQRVPKVIDFGVAKATSQRLTERSVFTEFGQLIGTPEYMSPEQAEMTVEDIDTRSDVYSLGVLLYELLTGVLPFDPRDLRRAGFDEIRRRIREEEPSRPSTRISTLGQAAEEPARRRQTDPRSLTRMLRGDLDWISMRALEKDRARRYGSPSELARDIERHLGHRPIDAGPPSAAYRLRKFVARHRAPVAAGALLFLMLAAFAAWMSVLYTRTDRLRREAETARADEQARVDQLRVVTEFQASMLAGIDAAEMGATMIAALRDETHAHVEDGSPPAADRSVPPLDPASATDVARRLVDEHILRRAVAATEEQFPEQPAVRSALRQTIADAYRELGMFDQALPLQEAALATRREAFGPDHPETLESTNQMGVLLDEIARYDEAIEHYRAAHDGFRRRYGHDDARTLTAANNLGLTLRNMGRMDEALEYYEATLAGCRDAFGADHPNTLATRINLGAILTALGRFDEALDHLTGALEGQRRAMGDEHPQTLTALNNTAHLLDTMGRYDEALPLYRECLETRRRVFGNDHPRTLVAIGNLAATLRAMGRIEEAAPYYREALDGNRRVLGDDHPTTYNAINNMGRLLETMGRHDEALDHYRQALDGNRGTLGERHPVTLGSLETVAAQLHQMGRVDEAAPLMQAALEGQRLELGDDHPDTLDAIRRHGAILLDQGRADEALALVSSAEETALRVLPETGRAQLAGFVHTLGRARMETGDFESAERDLLEAHALIDGAPGATAEDVSRAVATLVSLYESWGAAEPGAGHEARAGQWRERSRRSGDGREG